MSSFDLMALTSISPDSILNFEERENSREILQLDELYQDGTEAVGLSSPEFTIIIVVQMSIVILLCILGASVNSLVFWIFNRRPALRSLSNRFVLSLITSNLLISSIIAPLLLLKPVLNLYITFDCLNALLSFLTNSTIFSAIFSTLLVATDRFFAVTSPLHYSMTITRSRSQIMIIFAWFLATILASPQFFLCFLTQNPHQLIYLMIHISQFIFCYFLPFTLLCWLYLCMYHAAHRNSERTRKHSISGELITVLDGSSAIIPQGIDFLTHYMNPFTKAQMTGSTNYILGGAKKSRRRSSGGSSSSLLFREEGRAIKTAFFVLASFLFCYAPHFIVLLLSSLTSNKKEIGNDNGNWAEFLSIVGILLSALLNPFIYVFRNKMAWMEVTKVFCGFLLRKKREKEMMRDVQNNNSHKNRGETLSPLSSRFNTFEETDEGPTHTPPPILPKSPWRSSLKSLTPQQSFNSESHSNNSSLKQKIYRNKPPFLRSTTLPEQQRVKFTPNLVRQQSYLYPIPSHEAPIEEIPLKSNFSSENKRLVRQDSVCSMLSTDSVLLFCPIENSCPIVNLEESCGRQDSGFSDKTIDSGQGSDFVNSKSSIYSSSSPQVFIFPGGGRQNGINNIAHREKNTRISTTSSTHCVKNSKMLQTAI